MVYPVLSLLSKEGPPCKSHLTALTNLLHVYLKHLKNAFYIYKMFILENTKWNTLYYINKMKCCIHIHIYFHQEYSRCISSHTQFPSSSNFKELGKEISWSWSYLQLRPPSAQWDCWWWNHPRTSQPLGSPSYEWKFIVIYNATWYRSIK